MILNKYINKQTTKMRLSLTIMSLSRINNNYCSSKNVSNNNIISKLNKEKEKKKEIIVKPRPFIIISSLNGNNETYSLKYIDSD